MDLEYLLLIPFVVVKLLLLIICCRQCIRILRNREQVLTLPVVTEYPVAQARALHPVTRQRLTRRTGTPYSYPSYQPAVLPPEGAGYPQGFAPAAGLPPSRAEPYSTYPSAPRVPNANVMPPSYEQAVCAKPPPHNPYASH